ncbi:MAG: hypothetical protein R3Y39_08970 [Rikenellaceae bacterium]
MRAFKSLRGTPAEAVFKKAVSATAISVLSDSQKNLKENGSQATGKAFSSGKVEPIETTSSNITSGVSYDANYAYYIEFGRKAGRMPPTDEIEQWLQKKGLSHSAYAVAKSIAQKGTEAKPFLYPALKKNRNTMTKYFKQYYDEFIKQFTG